jgi:hypothetical protein
MRGRSTIVHKNHVGDLCEVLQLLGGLLNVITLRTNPPACDCVIYTLSLYTRCLYGNHRYLESTRKHYLNERPSISRRSRSSCIVRSEPNATDLSVLFSETRGGGRAESSVHGSIELGWSGCGIGPLGLGYTANEAVSGCMCSSRISGNGVGTTYRGQASSSRGYPSLGCISHRGSRQFSCAKTVGNLWVSRSGRFG